MDGDNVQNGMVFLRMPRGMVSFTGGEEAALLQSRVRSKPIAYRGI